MTATVLHFIMPEGIDVLICNEQWVCISVVFPDLIKITIFDRQVTENIVAVHYYFFTLVLWSTYI